MKYSAEALERFINATLSGKPIDREDATAAAFAIIAARRGDDIRGPLGLRPKPGQRRKAFDPDQVMIGSPPFDIVLRLVADRLHYPDAIEQFNRLVPHVTPRTVERYIAAIRPRAESMYASRGNPLIALMVDHALKTPE